MNARDLPKWVWDLVMSLEAQEAEHPKLYLDTSRGFVPSEWCPGESLKHVPNEVRQAAQAIAAYQALANADKEPGDAAVTS